MSWCLDFPFKPASVSGGTGGEWPTDSLYGWSYTEFQAYFGWDHIESSYYAWENLWARKVDAYIFTDAGATPRLSEEEADEVADLVNEMLTQMNIYLKAEEGESPLRTGFYEGPGFPQFKGDPSADRELGSGHYRVLNKYRRKYSESETRVDSIRIGVIPDDNPYNADGVLFK